MESSSEKYSRRDAVAFLGKTTAAAVAKAKSHLSPIAADVTEDAI